MKRFWIWSVLLLSLAVTNELNAQRNAGERFAQARERIVLRNLTRLNTKNIEFSPTYFRDGLVFVSSRQKGGYVDQQLGETYFDLFFAKLDSEGSPGRAKSFSLELNSPLHEGPVTFSPDESTIYFTRNNQAAGAVPSNGGGRITLKIYEATWGPYNDWVNVQELPFNSGAYSCMHPALSPDGNRLYFASDMPGGFGQRDIYMVEKMDGKWSRPINLGPRINTAGNESYPFFHDSGYFFFASDGHPGEGGLDLYMMDMGSKRWGELINLGTPFNTPDDDFGFLMHASGTRGYFSSNRQDGLGKDDIYMFYVPDGLGGVEVVNDVLSQIQVWDADHRRAVSEAAVYLLPTDSLDQLPSGKNELLNTMEKIGAPTLYTNNSGQGRLELNPDQSYLILVYKEGYVPNTLQLYAGGMPPAIEIQLEKVDCITLNGRIENSATGGVVTGADVIIRNGCTGEEVTLESSTAGKYTYCLEMGCSFSITAEKPGFITGSTAVSTEHLRGNRMFRASLRLKPDEAYRPRGGAHSKLVTLDKVQFASGSERLLPSSYTQLERLAKIMEAHPQLQIELGAHTDSRGNERLNQKRSLRRAEAVKALLEQWGIDGKRIRAFGYGESFLLNHCREDVPCSEAEHRANQRIEVKIPSGQSPLTISQLANLLQSN